MKSKVLIIFPNAPNTSDASHYPYWHKIFQEASQSLNLAFIYENQVNPLRRFFTILENIRNGYRNVYIHYSYWSVIMTRVIKLFIPVKIYYWDCEWYETKPNNILLDIALRWCDVFVTGSQSIGEQYRKIFFSTKPYTLYPKLYRVVPNWSERVDVQPLQLNKQQTHILFVHHLSPRKGSRELPEIISQTVKSIPDAHFHIIGDGPDLAILRSCDLTNTTFYGNLPLPEVRRYLDSCDIFIMPSRSEGFPRVILEAMNYGLPVVTTDVGNVRELVGATNQQCIVPPKDPASFTSSLVALIQNQTRQQKIIAENSLNAKEYSLENSTEAFKRVFKAS